MSEPSPSQTISCTNCGHPLISRYKNYTSPSAQSLHSSNVLPMHEIQNHRKTALDIQSELSHVDSEIVRVQIILDQLACERQRLLETFTQYQALVSPIRRLPTEILSDIFTTIPHDPPFDISKGPVLFTLICSRWRDIVISNPRMWNYISFSVDDKLNMKPFTISMWKIWLSRSGSCPLRIKVRFQTPQTLHFPYRPIVDMLASYSHRWSDVFIRIPFSLDHFSVVKGSIPILKTFNVISTNVIDTTALAMLEEAPNLRTLGIQSVPFVVTQRQLPWAQLTCFLGRDISVENYILILRYCPNLIWCRLLFSNFPSGFIPVSAFPVIMFHLREMRICTIFHQFYAYIFDSLSCPALVDLHMEPSGPSFPLTWPQDRLSSFLARSSCVLQRLDLRSVMLGDLGLVACLEELPSLVKLHISGLDTIPPGTLPLFDRMTYGSQLTAGDHSKLLVPKLKELSLNFNFPLNGELLLGMIQSRWGPIEGNNDSQDIRSTSVTTLESVHLTFRHKVDCEQFARATGWRDEGLDIQITVEGKRWL